MTGRVYLVGAGPGDPELFTLKGVRCLRTAEVVVYDRLASDELLRYAPPDAELIFVGKQPAAHAMPQDKINALLVEHARRGRTVVRLKGGDPFLFGRGGEEALALTQAGVPFEIVPGITSALAAPAYAGIPVTHRGVASSLLIVTGHETADKAEPAVDFGALASADTLVILMGRRNLDRIVRDLLRAGRPPTTPVALVQWGTTPTQATISGPLNDILSLADQQGLTAPAAIVVGDVVPLREDIKWFELLPLFGARIGVTRPRDRADELCDLLRARGALPVRIPTIKTLPAEDLNPLREAIARLSEYDWLLFTSVTGVSAFFDVLHESGGDARRLSGLRLAAIGPATTEALAHQGLHPDLEPAEFTTPGLLKAFAREVVRHRSILFPRAALAPPTLPRGLRDLGAAVHVVPAYRTVADESAAPLLRSLWDAGELDILTFTSGSTVEHFRQLLGPERLANRPAHLAVAALGPLCADAARAAGLRPDLVGTPPIINFVADLEQLWADRRLAGPADASLAP